MTQKRRWTKILLLSLALAALAGMAYWGGTRAARVWSAWRNPVVGPQTLVTVERVYLCGDRELVQEGPAPPEWQGLQAEALLRRFPAEEGWRHTLNLPVSVHLVQEVNELCPRCRSYRHLGIKDGYLAVFAGPLGCDRVCLYQEKRLPVSSLPPDFRAKLEKAMDFTHQLPEVQAQLRQELEFPDEKRLKAALENLDELQE
ncbi:hypothetical protein Adeg_1633 [Ammonifex degensii KC4]|uniref:Bypass of forespore C C-terminal domain-containing protein n=1 Tax=Ammonifex degensii (strain DSM 10501 / KC4) TaxID=429009 RepID=C9R8U8_AMMDK|nr:hypothetical protein [Ammonifex degensii]ACX52727.1 hypothetical protein Adeg_1633 [Ammonifex degensii KC4]